MSESKPKPQIKKKLEVLKMKDNAEDYRVHKPDAFDLPMRVLVVGKSQYAGKTNLVGNIILRPYDHSDETGKQFYAKDFEGRNIYIVCPSTDLDSKYRLMIDGKKIPEGNIYHKYDEEELTQLYDRLEKTFHERVRAGLKPEHVLIICDDCSFSGSLKDKMFGILTKIACNGRHILISMICTSQKYSQIQTTLRENATGLMLYEATNKQLDLIIEDHCQIPKKDFIRIFRETTREPHSFMVINYSNNWDHRLMNQYFLPLEIPK